MASREGFLGAEPWVPSGSRAMSVPKSEPKPRAKDVFSRAKPTKEELRIQPRNELTTFWDTYNLIIS